VSKKARKTPATKKKAAPAPPADTKKKAAKPAKKAVRAPVSKAKKAAPAPPAEIPLEQRAKSALDSAIARGVAGIATVLVDNEGSHAEINEAAANTAVQELSAYAREAVREKIQKVIAPESAAEGEKKHGWQQPGPGRGHATHEKMDAAAALAVIDDYADGISVTNSCKQRNLRRTAFYDFINEGGNAHLKRLFESRERAHCDALCDEMRDAPFNCIDQQQATNIYRINAWLAGKKIPKVYGDLQKLAIVDEKGKGVKLGAIVVPAKAGKPA
jgi:hypothetical protein